MALLTEQKQAIIHRAVTQGLDPSVPMKASGIPWLGEIPAHWKVMAAREIGSISKGSGGSKRDTTASGVSCVRYGELYSKFDRMIRRPWGFVSAEVARGYTPIRYGDVLFAASGEKLDEIGKSAVNLMNEPAVCGGDVIILRPAQSLAHAFAGYAFENPVACAQKSSFGRGTTIKHLYPSELRTLMVALPPLPEQAAVVAQLDEATADINSTIERTQRQIGLLREYRARLVADVVTGKLDVRAFAETLPDEAPDDIEAIEADVDEDADDDETGDGADEG